MEEQRTVNRLSPIDWLVPLAKLVVSVVFIYAGITKALTPVRFATDISNYHLLPWTGGAILAFYLPWLEIVSAIAVWFRHLSAGASFLLLAMVAVFIVASLAARLRGIDVSCGCFGAAGRNLSFTSHLIVDVLLFIALVIVFAFEIRRSRVGEGSSPIPTLSC
jgi:hypothetical protein